MFWLVGRVEVPPAGTRHMLHTVRVGTGREPGE